MPVKSIKIESAARRAALFALGLICLFGAFTFIKWCLANALSTQANEKDIAAVAVAGAPDDPRTHYISAILLEKTFEDLPKSLEEYEKATALSRAIIFWACVGKARERNRRRGGAEKRAKLWKLPRFAQSMAAGNVLLRTGKNPMKRSA